MSKDMTSVRLAIGGKAAITLTLAIVIQIAVAEVEPATTDPWAGKPVMSAQHVKGMVPARLRNAPRTGEMAPDFSLVDAASGRVVTLSQLRSDKPVVLFFLSYSCHVSHEVIPLLAGLKARFGERVNFALIYIQEAHPAGGFEPVRGCEGFVIPAPRDFASRAMAALRFGRETKLGAPVLVDSMDDATAVRWAAWPVRLFVIDRDGTTIYAGQAGPWFIKPTPGYDSRLAGVPRDYQLPGYSTESVEEFLAARFAGK